MRREPWLVVGLVAVAVVFASVEPDGTWLGPSTACEAAVVVHGELRCGDEAALAVAAACGPEAIAIAGDAIDDCNAPSRMSADDLALLQVPIDVNAAERSDLESLPGVGPVVAGRIVEGRPYASVDALDRVKGIGPKTLHAMRPRVTLHPPRIP